MQPLGGAFLLSAAQISFAASCAWDRCWIVLEYEISSVIFSAFFFYQLHWHPKMYKGRNMSQMRSWSLFFFCHVWCVKCYPTEEDADQLLSYTDHSQKCALTHCFSVHLNNLESDSTSRTTICSWFQCLGKSSDTFPDTGPFVSYETALASVPPWGKPSQG